MRVYRFWAPKEGNREDEYEDAGAGNPQTGCFAVADGATESSFSREWAEIQVKGFVTEGRWEEFFKQSRRWFQWRRDILQQWSQWLEKMRTRWRERLEELKSSRGGQWPWFVEDRIREGAVATFCGLVLLSDTQPPDECRQSHNPVGRSAIRRYFCLAVGDACLFQLRDNRLVFSFPMKKAADFNNTPSLLCSQTLPPAWPTAPLRWCIRRWNEGDTFVLMTDALARWFLSEYEAGNDPWPEIRSQLPEPHDVTNTNPASNCEDLPAPAESNNFPDANANPEQSADPLGQCEHHESLPNMSGHESQPDLSSSATASAVLKRRMRFRSWVADLRSQQKLANDDVTLLIIQSGPSCGGVAP